MKRLIALVLVVLALSASSLLLFAHSGRTDSNGGHWNHFSGEYHYHHGYGAHQHYDKDGDGYLDCPYDPYYRGREKVTTKYSDATKVVTTKSEEEKKAEAEENRKRSFKTIAFIALFICGIFILNKISVFLDRRKKAAEEAKLLEEKNEMIEKYGGKTIEDIVNAPEDSEIGGDNLPRVKGSESAWGEKYTFYTNYEGTRYHCYHCRHACHSYAQNAYNLRKKEPCGVCKPQLPDMQWVDEYKKIKAIKQKYHIDEEDNQKE